MSSDILNVTTSLYLYIWVSNFMLILEWADALGMVEINLIFFIAAHMVLWFGFIFLITKQCLNRTKAFLFFLLCPFHWVAWNGTWLETLTQIDKLDIPDPMMTCSSIKSQWKEVEGEMIRITVFVFPSSCYMCPGPGSVWTSVCQYEVMNKFLILLCRLRCVHLNPRVFLLLLFLFFLLSCCGASEWATVWDLAANKGQPTTAE